MKKENQLNNMKVALLSSTPLWVCSTAIRKCWASEGKSDTYLIEGEAYHEAPITHGGMCDTLGTGPKDTALIERVGNKNKHGSTLEHLNYTFDIDGISRACLQELARHRHTSLSVKSTRYTLKELKDTELISTSDYFRFIVDVGNEEVNFHNIKALQRLQLALKHNTPNDVAKYCLPEAYKTSLVWTINARSLQNFLSLRTDKAALWEIRELALAVYAELPEDHKYLFTDFIKGEINYNTKIIKRLLKV